jgi:uncharacterized protein YigE (DUF2233 family)
MSMANLLRLATLALLTSAGLTGAEVVEASVLSSGVKFRVVRVAPERVQLVWKDATGVTYRRFDRVQSAFAKQGKSVKFIMNAGIFEPSGVPSGLHIEDGKTLRPLNTADSPGNFFLKPNGVCVISNSKAPVASISTCETWKSASDGAEILGIQSGPMLLIGGNRHPAFRQGSDSKLHRNGVGVDAEKRLVFAMTAKDEVVNFWDFAGLFLQLGCRDALFLDGDISQMAVNPSAPVMSNLFGAMFVIAE